MGPTHGPIQRRDRLTGWSRGACGANPIKSGHCAALRDRYRRVSKRAASAARPPEPPQATSSHSHAIQRLIGACLPWSSLQSGMSHLPTDTHTDKFISAPPALQHDTAPQAIPRPSSTT